MKNEKQKMRNKSTHNRIVRHGYGVSLFSLFAFSFLLLTGCKSPREVDEVVETDRYTLHIQDVDTWCAATGNHNVDQYYKIDTTVFSATIPQLALHLASVTRGPVLDSVMFYINVTKQNFLPHYVYTIVDHDTTQPKDYTPLMQALIDRGILRADTTYEPRQLLVVFDTARLTAHRKMEADLDFTNTLSMAVQMQESYHKPVTLGPGVEMDIMTDGYWLGDDWTKDSLWLDERGLRVIPDPKGSLLRIVTFNRAKGKI